MAVDKVEQRLTNYGESSDKFGLIHGDLRTANLLVSGADTYVIDFDACRFGWYFYDAATALTGLEDQDEAPTWLRAWAAGYQRHAVLTNEDREILPSLLMLRWLLILAWLGSHLHGESADRESADYLEGTCRLAGDYLNGALNWL